MHCVRCGSPPLPPLRKGGKVGGVWSFFPPCEGSEFRVFGIAVNSYATSRIGRLSNHNMEN